MMCGCRLSSLIPLQPSPRLRGGCGSQGDIVDGVQGSSASFRLFSRPQGHHWGLLGPAWGRLLIADKGRRRDEDRRAMTVFAESVLGPSSPGAIGGCSLVSDIDWGGVIKV